MDTEIFRYCHLCWKEQVMSPADCPASIKTLETYDWTCVGGLYYCESCTENNTKKYKKEEMIKAYERWAETADKENILEDTVRLLWHMNEEDIFACLPDVVEGYAYKPVLQN